MNEMLWRVMRSLGMGRARVQDDGGPVQRLQVKLSDIELRDDTPRVAEYGFQSRPPDGFDAVLLFLGGDRTAGVVIATGHQQYRVKSLAPGEVCISDDKGQKIHLSTAGIRIEGGGNPISISGAPTVTVTGGDVIADGISLKHHVHPGVQAGGSSTGQPI